jgi:hypothetical protein
VHDARFPGEEPNPHPGLTRWAPVHDSRGRVLPSLYIATSREVAVAEAVLHDVGFGESQPLVLAARLAGLAITKLALERPLSLIDLTGLGLRRLKADPHATLYGGPLTYSATTEFATKLLATAAWARGILYPSRQFPGGLCAVAYQRRAPVALRVVETMALGAGPGRAVVDRICADAGVTVVA